MKKWPRWRLSDVVPESERPEDDIPMRPVSRSDLELLNEEDLRRVHARVIRAVFAANGPRRMGLGGGMLKPIEAEMRRRGLVADYWTMDHLRRSDQAFRAELN